mgnify:CR=1 FL=1
MLFELLWLLMFVENLKINLKIPFSFKGSAKVVVGGVSAIFALKIFTKKALFSPFLYNYLMINIRF